VNIVAIVGSLRKESYNMQLAKSIKERYTETMNVEIVDIGLLPFFNEDIENNPPESVVTFKKKVADAEGVIIVTPEYNWSIPGVLKNALDWLSRVDRVLINKPVMTAGASPVTLGTVRAQLHLRQVLSSPGLNAKVLPPAGNEVLVNFAGEKFDDTGRLSDEKTLQFLDGVIEKFVEFVKKEGTEKLLTQK
jgi:chromate reductase, NAD(P)H dehydrogenase (quinone)